MTVNAQKETLGFQAEVKQLLHLVTHALYSNKEIFLRELISNASDAADKLRFAALKDSSLYEDSPEPRVRIDVNKDARTITVSDNGIGMSKEEIIEHLGTIAKSGTREFLQALSGDQTKDSQLIGQFGVGFYSAFIVADKVTVISRRAGVPAEQGVRWVSKGEGEYTVEQVAKTRRGTDIILHLKKDENEFLEDYRLRSIINKYSDHISIPIEMLKPEMPETDEDEKTEDKDKAEKTTEKAEKAPEYESVNRAKALWTLPKSKIKDEDYQEFYKHVSHDFDEPLTWVHNKVEGKLEYTSLLYIPKHAPFDLWNRERHQGLKLYVQRVFIMDDAEVFLPNYLRFVKGIVDCNDLPLNISRELLQSNKTVESIRAALVKRILGMLTKLAEDDKEKYAQFWEAFGQVIKEGPAEDFTNREKIAKILRFSSTQTDNVKQDVSLDDYISRMKPEQEHIYYVTAESFNAALHSPHLEVFRKKGIEVLLLSERVDEWLVTHLNEYNEKKLQSVARGGLDLGKLEDEEVKQAQEKAEKDFESITKQIKEILGEKVKEVRVTQRLTDSPACLVTDENDMSAQMQRMLQAAGQSGFPGTKPIFEINPEHAIITKLKNEQDDERFKDWTNILFDQALLAEGGQLDDPGSYVKRLNQLLLELTK